MNKEEVEELAFKNRKELANVNELDLLEIIEFLQLDRRQWINQYSKAHNDYVDLQRKYDQVKEIEKEHKKINGELREVIKKATEILNKYRHYSTPTEEQNSINEDLVIEALEILNKSK